MALASPSPPSPGTIVFFHPDLGIGGAERLVVDAAVGLQSRGHRVVIFTNHCDPGHCFDECRDGTLDVRVRGSWLIPMSIASRLTILCAILRHIHLLTTIYVTGELASLAPEAFVVDQLSAGLPLMRYLTPNMPILFYCHFPDLLLAQGRQSAIKRLYRVPFDAVEEWSMGFAHAVAVNSEFTSGIVKRTWPQLQDKVRTKVVYPCVDTDVKAVDLASRDKDTLSGGNKLILSINRFERKKDIGLAIKAFAAIPDKERKGVRLVLAGGYDHRVSENVQYHTELQTLASSLSLTHHTLTPSKISTIASLADVPASTEVLFLLSVPSTLKEALLHTARLIVYTPSNEHFGIVPIEAMLAGVPVLVANTGGPVESIRDNQTGWLRDPEDVDGWSVVMRTCLSMSDKQLSAMGAAGEQRVKSLFGRDKLAERLDAIVDEIVQLKPRATLFNTLVNLLIFMCFVSVTAASAVLFMRVRGGKEKQA